MNITTTPHASHRSAASLLGVFAVAAVAYVLDDLLHELGHTAATLLPVGVKAIFISTVGMTSVGHSPVVAIAGPLVNFALGSALFIALSPKFPPYGVTSRGSWVLSTYSMPRDILSRPRFLARETGHRFSTQLRHLCSGDLLFVFSALHFIPQVFLPHSRSCFGCALRASLLNPMSIATASALSGLDAWY